MPPNDQTWHPTPIVGADNPWQEAEEATQESLPTSAAAQAEEIGEWTRWSRENPLQSESAPPTQGQCWAEEPNPSTSKPESEFDPVQGPFPDWEGSPPTPWKDREEDFVPLPVGFQRCPTCSRFVRGGRWALRQHQFSSSGCIAARTGAAAKEPCYLCGKMLAAGDHWARTQHSRSCRGRRPEQGQRAPQAHPTNNWDGDEWHDSASASANDDRAYWSWNERQEPTNNSDSYQGAWRWGQHEWVDHSSNESYCHSEWGNTATAASQENNNEWTTSRERQHGWQEAGQYNPRWYENENEQDHQNQWQAHDYHQPNRDRWRHEEQPSGGDWWQDHQETDYHQRWRQAGEGHWQSNSDRQRHTESTPCQDNSWQQSGSWQNSHDSSNGWWDSSA